VNYYATGADSISFHGDDEPFLGPNPAIASFTLSTQRDLVLKHQPGDAPTNVKQIKRPFASDDMVLIRGPTQAHWLHSTLNTGAPKQIEADVAKGLGAGGQNYYHYNIGGGV